MRHLRKLLLAVASVVAALAFSAPAAMAQQEPVEVSNETTEEHCSDFTMVDHEPVGATCTVRIVSERPFVFWLHEGMVEHIISECDTVFEAAFNEDGQGFIYNQELTPERGECGREPCDEAEDGETPHKNLAWPAEITEVAPGQLNLRVELCLYAHSFEPETEGTTGIPCVIDLGLVDENPGPPPGHAWEVGTPPIDRSGNGGAPCINLGGAIEIDCHWLFAPNQAHPDGIEIDHLPDE
jgi:hypothetical protein